MTQPTIPVSQRKIDAGKVKGAVAVPNCIEIVVIWQLNPTLQGRVALNGRNPGSVVAGVALANTLLASLGGAWSTRLGLYSASTVTLGATAVRDMSNPANPQFFSTGTGFSGTSASPLLPLEVALVLTENVNVRGRGAKGRMYIPGFATNADAGGGLAIAAVQTAMNGLGTDWFAAIGAAGLTPTVAKPPRLEYIGVTGAHHAARAAATADVVTYTCRDVRWDSQRRRAQV